MLSRYAAYPQLTPNALVPGSSFLPFGRHGHVVPVVKLTARGVATLPPGNGARIDYRDEGLPGFFLRVSPTGHRSFGVVYSTPVGVLRRLTIGTTPPLSLADAREKARGIIGRIMAEDADPQAEKVRSRRSVEARTFAQLAERFMEKAQLRPATRKTWRHLLDRNILLALGHLPAAGVTKADVRRMMEDLQDGRGGRRPTPIGANRSFEVVRRIFNWAVERDEIAASPCTGIKKLTGERIRERTYSSQELRAILRAAEGVPELEHFLPLVAYTAARSHETLAARWTDIDAQRRVWTIPPEHAKSQAKHEVPLSPGALRVIVRIRRQQANPSPWLFPAETGPCDVCGQPGHAYRPNKALRTLSLRLGMLRRVEDKEAGDGKPPKRARSSWTGEAIRPHDIRRTVSNSLRNDLGVPPYVVDFGVLAHTPPRLHGTYMPGVNLPEVRDALDRWSGHLEALMRESAGKRYPAKGSRVSPR